MRKITSLDCDKLDDRYQEPYPLICFFCRHYIGNGECKAFDEIPMEIWQAERKHDKPTANQIRRRNFYVFQLNPFYAGSPGLKNLPDFDRLESAE